MNAYYVRTSKAENSGSAQLEELRRWSEKEEGWQKVEVYMDVGESGAKDERPEWDRLRKDVARGKVKAIACTELSRIGRSVLNVIMALDAIYRADCRVVLLRQGLDYATPIGRAMAAMLAAFAQLERDQIRERLVAGVRRTQAIQRAGGSVVRRDGSTAKPIGRQRKRVSMAEVAEIKSRNWSLRQAIEWLNAKRQPKERLSKSTLCRAMRECEELGNE